MILLAMIFSALLLASCSHPVQLNETDPVKAKIKYGLLYSQGLLSREDCQAIEKQLRAIRRCQYTRAHARGANVAFPGDIPCIPEDRGDSPVL